MKYEERMEHELKIEAIRLKIKPIRLAEILIAFSEEEFATKEILSATATGIYRSNDKGFQELVSGWDCHQDSLEKQGKETIEFLYSMIIDGKIPPKDK